MNATITDREQALRWLIDNRHPDISLEQALRILRAARFVKARKQGKQVFYVATDDRVRCIIRDMVVHVGGGREDIEETNEQ